jgi:hypothetical protein
MGHYFRETNVGVATLKKFVAGLRLWTAMRRAKHDDPNLDEVKAVLERLQRISRYPRAMQTAGEHAASRPLPQPPESPVSAGDFRPSSAEGTAGAGQANITKPRTSLGFIPFTVGFAKKAFLADQWLVKTAAAAVLAVGIGITIFAGLNQQAPSVAEPPRDVAPQAAAVAATDDSRVGQLYPPTALPTPRAPGTRQSQAALEAASRFITSGHVQAARAELLRVAQEGSADVAWAIARSYDPNFLGMLSDADAGPDVAEATRWYRAWYDIAVKQGLVADSVSLDRIVRSMH